MSSKRKIRILASAAGAAWLASASAWAAPAASANNPYGLSALWSQGDAVARATLLILVVNNRSFFNDEIHQERVAQTRARPVANRWIGQRIGDPEIDLAQMARAQGARGIGPVTEPATLEAAIAEGIRAVEAGKVCVIDIRVAAGYDAATAAAMVKAQKG